MKLKTRLITGFSVVALIALAIGCIGTICMMRVDKSADRTFATGTMGIVQAQKILTAIDDLRTSIRDEALSVEESTNESANESYQNGKKEMEEALNGYATTLSDKEDEENLEKLRASVKAYIEESDKVMALGLANKNAEAADIVRSDTMKSVAKTLLANLNTITESNANNVKLQNDQNGHLIDISLILMISAALVAVIVSLIIGYSIAANRTLIEAQRDSYARFVPERMLELFDKSNVTDVQPRDCKALELTVMFSDIRSYTAISESLSCDDVFGLLNAYFEITNPIIGSNGGIIDKYIGDAILSVFPNSPDGALRSVIAINRELRAFNEERRKRAEPEILTGTGIHFGKVDLGTVGDRTRLQATVIGDAVNLASRLESATKAFGVRILMSEAARERLANPSAFRLRAIDTVRVKGKEQPINLYEVYDLDATAVIERKAESGAIFSEALQRYKAGN